MKVLHVINTLHSGGAEAHLLLLAKGLLSRGLACEVAFLRSAVAGGSVDLRQAFEESGVRTHHLRCESSFDPRSAIRLNHLMASAHWDVLHSHLPRADAAAAVCRLLHRGRPWISTLHHPYDNAYSGARLIPALAPMWRLADGVIAVSESVRQWSIERLGLNANHVHTIVHGIELRQRAAAPCDTPSAPGAPRFHIGAIGRYEARKGHETLIRAMPSILEEFPAAALTIAGHDPWGHGDALRRIIEELDLGAHVELVGFTSDKEAFFSNVDVFAFASRSEGFGIVLLEAMEAGKPVVVSNISPLKEIISPGTTGLVAEPGDPASFAAAIVSLFRDRNALRRMGTEARKRVASEFSDTAMVDKTLQLYRDVRHEVRTR
jgi:glycosyltransferase involved in cell wall biosynthesis